MPVYKCPQCHADGFIQIEEDWDEWMLKNFGEFHTYEPTDVLPLECDRCKALTPLARKMMNQVIEQKGYAAVKPQPMQPVMPSFDSLTADEQLKAYMGATLKWRIEPQPVEEISKEEKEAKFKYALEQLQAARRALRKKASEETAKKKVSRTEAVLKGWDTRRAKEKEMQLKLEALRMKRSAAAKKAWKKRRKT